MFMKRKLSRASIDEVLKEMPILENNEKRNILGGTQVSSIRINGGYLISYDYENREMGKLTVYQPDGGGQPIIFDGVTCSYGDINGCAYQLNGIHVGENPEYNFDISTMIHEYGHVFQQKLYFESLGYVVYAGAGSAAANIYQYFGGNYYDYPTENEASRWGQAYIDQYYPNSGYKAEGL